MRSARSCGMLRDHDRCSPGDGRARLDRHLLGQPLGNVVLQGGQALRGRAKQIHGRNPRQHEVARAGGGVSVVEARRAAMTLSG